MSESEPSATSGAVAPHPDTTERVAVAQPPSMVAPPPATTGMVDRRQQWEEEFRDVQRVCVFYAAMLLPILVLTGYAFHTKNDAVEIELWGGAVFYATIAGFAIAWRNEWAPLVRWPVAWSGRWLALTVVAPLCSIPAAYLVGRWAQAMGWPVNELTAGFREGGYPVWVSFLWVAVLPPICEEIAFRVILLPKLQKLMRQTQALWVSAVLFGVLHFSLVSMAVFLVPIAAVAAYLTRETRSLMPAIAMHAAHNAGIVSLEMLGW